MIPDSDTLQFLRRLYTQQRTMQLSAAEVELLRHAAGQGDPMAQYGYGRWLYFAIPHDDAMQEAEQLFFAAKETVADSLAVYSQMLRYGETSLTHPAVMDLARSEELLAQAIGMGSELAAIMKARHCMFGNFCPADPQAAIEAIRQRMASDTQPDTLWHCLLGHAYEELGQRDKAIAHYEQAISLGEPEAYGYLATLYLQRGNTALYEEYMEEGIEKGDTLCLLYQADTDDDLYRAMPPEEQSQLHLAVDSRLQRGLRLSDGACAYYLWLHHFYGTLGFTRDEARAFAYLHRGVQLGHTVCMAQMASSAADGELPPSMALSPLAIDELRLRAARYCPGDDDLLRDLQMASDPAFLLKHKAELDQYWHPLMEERLSDMDVDDGRYDAYV